MVNGWGASLTWNGQGIYVTECASNSNKGLYNSVLWMGNMATYISGNLMAAFVISDLSESLFYMIMTAICVITTIYFIFLPTPQPQIEDAEADGVPNAEPSSFVDEDGHPLNKSKSLVTSEIRASEMISILN